MAESRELSRQECLELLGAGSVARIAVMTPEGPHIIPVNYSIFEDTVVVRTASYSLLGTHARDAVVALEIDDVESSTRSGWSVLCRGRCTVETNPRTIRSIRQQAPDGPWAGGTRNVYLRLRTDQLSGRAVGDLTPAATGHSLAALRTGSADAHSRA